jgi:hypothetical protein
MIAINASFLLTSHPQDGASTAKAETATWMLSRSEESTCRKRRRRNAFPPVARTDRTPSTMLHVFGQFLLTASA